MSIVTSCDLTTETITLHVNGRDLTMSKADATNVFNQLADMLDGLRFDEVKAMVDKTYGAHK